MTTVGQIVETLQGLYGKSPPGGQSEAEGFSKGKPEGAAPESLKPASTASMLGENLVFVGKILD